MSAEHVLLVIDLLAALVQLSAAVIALSLIRLSGRQWTWIVLTCGFIGQTYRRLYVIASGPSPTRAQESVTALLVSAFMLLGVIGIRRVFRELSDTRSQLEHLARSDSLTGLPNRAAFLSALEREISRVKRGSSGIVLFADIDGFKVCNDAHGHAFGDVLLGDIAEALRAEIREPDLVARIGGDEFAVVLDESDLSAGRAAADRLRRAVRGVSEQAGTALDLSVGVVRVDATLSAEDVVAAADREMYAAKRSTRPRPGIDRHS